MELFFSRDFDGKVCRLDPDESAHCVKVLRHREGDMIHVIDGEGTLYNCRLLDASPKSAEAEVVEVEPDWGSHPYFLQMAVCPTKNIDRYEWFAEKATELGVDVITPVIGDHSERKVFKTDRLKRILLSASKQSLKGAVPRVDEPVNLSDFIRSLDDAPDRCFSKMNIAETGTLERSEVGISRPAVPSVCLQTRKGGKAAGDSRGQSPLNGGVGEADVFLGAAPAGNVIKLIACCYEGEEKRVSIDDALKSFAGAGTMTGKRVPEIVILIGPEGDFSREEVELAIKCGFKPVHLGPSRLRTETAALTAVAAVYFHFARATDCYTDD